MKRKIVKALLMSALTSAVGVSSLCGTSVYAKTITIVGVNETITNEIDWATIKYVNSLEWKTMYATTKVNIREHATENSEVVCTVVYNGEIQCAEYNSEWYRVRYDDTHIYFVKKEFITDEKLNLPEYSDYEIELLAKAAFREANTLGTEGMINAVSVIINRVLSDKFPDTVYGVLSQSGQYACWNGSGISGTPTDEAYEAVQYVIEHGPVFPSYVLYQSERVLGDGVYSTLGNTYYSCDY